MSSVSSLPESPRAQARASGTFRLHERASQHRELLLGLAGKYIEWQSAEDAVEFPRRVIAKVMNDGDSDDVGRIAEALGDDCLREVLQHAEAGQFSDRAWHDWHHRLGLATFGQVPPLPTGDVSASF